MLTKKSEIKKSTDYKILYAI